MVSFESMEEAESFLQNNKLWGPWFSNLDLWEGQILAVERIAWIRVQGLPLHLADSEILRKIGEAYGKILYVPKDVGEESDLSFNRVAVLAGNDARIKEFLCLRWKDKSFRVWVMEEDEVWVPDCLSRSKVDLGSSEAEKESSPEEEKEISGLNSHVKEVEQVDEAMGDVPISDNVGKETHDTFFGVGDEDVNSSAAVSPMFVCQSSKANQIKVGGPRLFKSRKGKKSVSPVGSSLELRPKKRSRAHMEKRDLFGLDDLISKGPYPFQKVTPVEVPFADVCTASDGGASLDLNRRASCSHGQPAYWSMKWRLL
ncbi:hypothetical protein HanXRQr2_Chr03g0125771 [Helianthus annuus]|uniref:Nucleotide-binding alpha-beta plait domain-containing protein n=1 Tax=Helianthus annuus TaxID=4232 RepID=A0A9K3JHF9_HELAN|nr:hypothetical protein HanXRQr2_Chr03g0125771 [Helianthus annuus]KAJ0594101.1 hypothetical protein HanHA300_Chr03g0104751 [Helianthus annuus]KAJ0602201.1 hypothetical protein HanIR_Chr03g0137041 [Helianthus annuus]KAJ0769188.1 hypothetical protein HanLR1_Chr03g0109991 [Helianthus annuus]KAJ0774937.1 hypothetical protein HanOQP8_Chr03g0117421 [Helianthus annuus]